MVVNNSTISADQTRVAIVVFGDNAEVRCLLTDHYDQQDVLLAIALTKYSGGQGSNLAEALTLLYTDIFTREHGDRSDVTNVAIVLTDDYSTVNAHEVPDRALMAADAGINLIAVSITDVLADSYLRSLASSDDLVFRAINFNALPGLSSIVLAAAHGTIPEDRTGEMNVEVGPVSLQWCSFNNQSSVCPVAITN